jgi:Phosphodiester glycosidase
MIPSVLPSRPGASHPTRPTRSGYLAPPDPIRPQTQPAQPREGFWRPLVSLNGQTAIRAAFLRPDGQFTSDQVGVAWLNQKLVKMALHPGESTPGGSGWSQPSQVPGSQRNSLLATFNSGFLMPAAQGGYWQDGITAVPLSRGAASLVFYKDGHVDVVRWTSATPGRNVAAVRQNLTLLIDHARITPEVDTGSWGATLGGGTYVWRSAVGIRKDGALVVAVGPSMSARSLANILRDAGAVRAMELDINPQWTNFITYTHPRKGVAVPHMLTKNEQPNPYRYLQPSSRDFAAVLAR